MKSILLALAVTVSCLFGGAAVAATGPGATTNATTQASCNANVCGSLETSGAGTGLQITAVNLCNYVGSTVNANTLAVYGSGGQFLGGRSLGDVTANTCVQIPVAPLQTGRSACAQLAGLRNGQKAYRINLSVSSGGVC